MADFRPPYFAQVLVPDTSEPPLAGLVHRYDARYAVYSDAGVTPAIDGSLVQQWSSLAGSGWNASQATPANRPIYHTNEINGQPALLFNGSLSFLGGTKVLQGHGGTRVVVAQPIDQDTGQFWWGGGNTTHGGSALSLVAADSQGYPTRLAGWYDSTTGWSRKLTRTTTTQSLQWDFKPDLTVQLWRNGVSAATGVFVDGWQDGMWAIGNRHTGNTYPYKGWIAQVLRYDHVLDATERAALNAWITTLYGPL